ncbi:DNA primase large subunit-like isoform X2 [Coccinella septempunctata]|uniref:DNA primase large subunit-like isoform X2 n=1 Tax=Coccinella septempunctata TaxID=41139 RepID=UPI001D090D74|nr:DNA primase large subunit-like isoform X2 [Coccinella septempunctata]
MDFTARKRKSLRLIPNNSNSQYSLDLSMYNIPPIGETSLEEFETLAIERLQLMRVLEQAASKGHKINSEEWKKCIKEDLNKLDLKKFVRLMNGLDGQTELDINARRADHLSHFILRLAYCRSEELRRWFINRELEWFRLRFMVQNQTTLNRFFESNKLIYSPISDPEKNAIFNELLMSTFNMSDVNIKSSNFFKVPFSEVCSLIRSRRVFVKLGYAYIPTNELIVCVQAKFRANLSEALNVANHRLPSLDDDRINTFLLNLNHSYTGKDYTSPSSERKEMDIADLDLHSKKHYPLCMRHIHETLRATHHLKHKCRLQYGLFLKGIGLTLEDAMDFWREEFTKLMDHNKFEKDYAYNIKHAYGKAGGMVNYSPYSCMKIIMDSVGAGDHHGCPFKHWDSHLMKQKLMDYGVSTEGSI